MPYIELVQEKNTINKFPSRFKRYSDMKPYLLSEHDHQMILGKIEARGNFNHDEYVEDEICYHLVCDDSDDDDHS